MRRPVRVAVVDDSAFMRKAVVRMLSGEQRIEVVGTAATGEELLDALADWRPDVVTLDLSMPGMGGLRTLDHLAERRGLRVIILSSHTRRNAPLTIEALHRGAADFIDKQRYSLFDFDALSGALREKILEVSSAEPASLGESPAAVSLPPVPPAATARGRMLLIGASTGGPPAIQRILGSFDTSLPVPVAIVQHMPRGFTRPFAARLNAHLAVPVREAKDGETLLPPTVYIAPAGLHLTIDGTAKRPVARLSPQPESTAHRPSIDVLFGSAARTLGGAATALLLTGMGKDGAQGMAELALRGAHTLAQEESSCVVFGMPRAAIQRGAVGEVLPLERIADRLLELLAGHPEPARG